jgi:poly(3-hydroxybutyrate) depolymerase
MFQVMAAWGEVTERTFARMVVKPDWNVSLVVGEDGRDHVGRSSARSRSPSAT